MELASDILKSKCNYKLDSNIISDINDLNIYHYATTLSRESFLGMMNSDEWLVPMSKLVDQIFYTSQQSKLPYALLHAYYLSEFYNEIFSDKCTTKLDEKLLYYSNKIVALMTSINESNLSDSDCLDTIDHYYSLYKVWTSKDVIKNIDEKLEEFKNTLNTYKIINSVQSDPILVDEMINIMQDNMEHAFNINTMLFVKLFLQLYYKFYKIDKIKTFFWDKIFSIPHTNFDHVFILLVAELRKCLIKKNDNCDAKKSLYYDIDIDNLIKKIRYGTIILTDYSDIVNILIKYVNVIDKDIINTHNEISDVINYNNSNNVISTLIILFDKL